MPRHTKKPSQETPRNPAQNPLYASDQQETSKVPTGSSTSVQDSTSNNIPSPFSLSRRALLTAYKHSPTPTNRNPLLIYLYSLEIPSHMVTPQKTKMNMTPKISHEWKIVKINRKYQE